MFPKNPNIIIKFAVFDWYSVIYVCKHFGMINIKCIYVCVFFFDVICNGRFKFWGNNHCLVKGLVLSYSENGSTVPCETVEPFYHSTRRHSHKSSTVSVWLSFLEKLKWPFFSKFRVFSSEWVPLSAFLILTSSDKANIYVTFICWNSLVLKAHKYALYILTFSK